MSFADDVDGGGTAVYVHGEPGAIAEFSPEGESRDAGGTCEHLDEASVLPIDKQLRQRAERKADQSCRQQEDEPKTANVSTVDLLVNFELQLVAAPPDGWPFCPT